MAVISGGLGILLIYYRKNIRNKHIYFRNVMKFLMCGSKAAQYGMQTYTIN